VLLGEVVSELPLLERVARHLPWSLLPWSLFRA